MWLKIINPNNFPVMVECAWACIQVRGDSIYDTKQYGALKRHTANKQQMGTKKKK